MFRAKVEPMPDNPAKNYIGDKSGLWRVAVYDTGSGSIREDRLMNYHAENLTYDEAA